MRNVLKNLFIFIILFCSISNVSFATSTDKPNVSSDDLTLHSNCLLLMEKNTGDILYEKNAYEKMYPASTTKIMTAILVIENCYLNEVVTVSSSSISAVPPSYSLSGLQAGEELRIEDLLYILLIPSANDVANLLAEHTSGSIPAFAELMNKKAQSLGLTGSHFTNPSGVHDKDLYTTAHDLAILTKYAMNNKKFMDIVKTSSYTIPSTNLHPEEDRSFTNSNLLLVKSQSDYFYEYATGIKTGFTDPAGDCLVASAKKDNVEFIAICLKGGRLDNGLREKFIDCKSLFDFAFDNYTTYYKNLQEVNANFSENASNDDNSLVVPSTEIAEPIDEKPSNTIFLSLALKVLAVLVIIIALKFMFFRKKNDRIYRRKR